jgi:hypothetical protein
LTIKASSLLSILAIWGAVAGAVAFEPGAWWSVFFAAMASGFIGLNASRRLGLSRLLAIAGIWAGAAIGFGSDSGATWMSVFAFLSTFTVVASVIKRNAVVNGLAIAAPWLASGAGVAAADGDGAWTCLFAFLTVPLVANGSLSRAIVGIIAWLVAGALMVGLEGHHWLSVIAFVATMFAFTGRPRLPRRFEWDLFERDDGGAFEGKSRPLN